MLNKIKLYITPTQNGYLRKFISYITNSKNFQISETIIAADAVIALVPTNVELLQNNQKLEIHNCKKPIFVIDYSEYGVSNLRNINYYDEFICNSLVGFKTESIKNKLSKNEYLLNINNFLHANLDNIRIYFLRELSNTLYQDKSIPFAIEPVDYVLPQTHLSAEVISCDDFFKKNLDICFVWGKTNSDRMALHGELMREMSDNHFFRHILTSYEQYEEYKQRENNNTSGILLMNKDAKAKERIDLFPILLNSKLCIDLYGNGMKCFRNPESSLYSISIKQDYSKLKFAYDWHNNQNCFFLPNLKTQNKLDIQESVKIILQILNDLKCRNKMYNIYLNSFNTATKYIGKNYAENFLCTKIIEKL